MDQLKQAAVLLASKFVGAGQIQELKARFQALDKNGDGCISLAELREALGSKLSEADLCQVMAVMDADGSGEIDYSEFCAAAMAACLLDHDELLLQVFAQLDKDGSGFLCAAEIAAAVGNAGAMSEAQARALIQKHDTNGDGVIDYKEFLTMMKESGGELKKAADALHVKVSAAGEC